jgi:hypothetical protein
MQLHSRPGFLQGFPHCGIGSGLIVFHETRRQCPVAMPGFDCTFAEQYARLAVVLPHRNRADHHLRVLIMNHAAMSAHVARAVVVRRNHERNRMSAFRTEFHRELGPRMLLRAGPYLCRRRAVRVKKYTMGSVSPRVKMTIAFALLVDTIYTSILQTRGGAVWQLVGLITRRSQVQILPPQPSI